MRRQLKELLEHSFVGPSLPFLGKVQSKQSLDGWRDDQFPRKVVFQTTSLKILEELVVSGQALAYLPEYVVENLELEMLKVLHCSYSCQQKIKILCRNPKELAWLNQVF